MKRIEVESKIREARAQKIAKKQAEMAAKEADAQAKATPEETETA